MTKLRLNVFLMLFASFLAFGVTSSAALSDQAKAKSSDAKVDLNTASEKDLESLPGVGTVTAKKIISGRPYSSADDLSKAGVSASTIKKITPLVTVSGAPTAASRSEKVSSPKTNSSASKSGSAPPSQPTAAAPSQPAPATSTAKSAASATTTASQGTPGAGKVWVTLDSGIYHYEGSRYYGKTKNGKYMSESDALAAGYRAAKNEKKPQ